MITSKTRTTDLLNRANAVKITAVLNDHFDVVVPSDIAPGTSWKTMCPFAWEHGDGGMDKNYRVYGSSNSSYCFAMHGQMNPVRLFQLKLDIRPVEAAQRLLEAYGQASGRSWRERYSELVDARERASHSVGSTPYLVEALHLALSKHPRYFESQFTTSFAQALEAELERLDYLLVQLAQSGETETDSAVRRWYQEARENLTTILDQQGVHSE